MKPVRRIRFTPSAGFSKSAQIGIPMILIGSIGHLLGVAPANFPVVPTPAHHLALGQAIRELRLEQGLSQEKLAARSGLDRSYVGGVERARRNPTFDSLLKLIEGLDVPSTTLFARYDEALTRRREEP